MTDSAESITVKCQGIETKLVQSIGEHEGEWFKFDDSVVSRINIQSKLRTNTPYIFIYERCNTISVSKRKPSMPADKLKVLNKKKKEPVRIFNKGCKLKYRIYIFDLYFQVQKQIEILLEGIDKKIIQMIRTLSIKKKLSIDGISINCINMMKGFPK